MRSAWSVAALAVATAGCLNPSAVEDTAAGIRDKVSPVAREVAWGSRRLVRSAGQAADDAALAARVKTLLLARKGVDSRDIHVQAADGTVTLTGRVSTRTQKKRAGEAVRETRGVAAVVNRLKVADRG